MLFKLRKNVKIKSQEAILETTGKRHKNRKFITEKRKYFDGDFESIME